MPLWPLEACSIRTGRSENSLGECTETTRRRAPGGRLALALSGGLRSGCSEHREGTMTETGGRAEVVPCPRWVRVRFGGRFVADSRRVMLLRQPGRVPVYYFPRDDVRLDCLVPSPPVAGGDDAGKTVSWTVAVG